MNILLNKTKYFNRLRSDCMKTDIQTHCDTLSSCRIRKPFRVFTPCLRALGMLNIRGIISKLDLHTYVYW